MSIHIRSETPADAAAIDAVTIAAFRSAPHSDHAEQFIIRALRESGMLSLSLVAEEAGQILGHVAASPVTISSAAGGWFGLGPISVQPPRHRQGIGALLMRQALTELRAMAAAGCVVLGDPRFYARFGFSAQPRLLLPGFRPDYFQAIAFAGAMPVGRVHYHESFAARG